ncbi:DUF262 domain-containing protein [Lacihabitans sp. LS3-19]|uniref:DUF262 domain-containing protein n=1 Tax=Lacihabitans sp. LS3-19 TaxID=2487335 RepID=UPI0020CC8087|nr:DUF262 domain-containing protein [Lacihabitans sp. LS3-19]MCP9768454.1 DUF262 domain-containing protein [Lacihabitans sp. LS3-19]
MNELQISTRVRRLFHYLSDFEKGVIRVPAFQRDFEWDNAKKIKLFESIKNGYPIGSILFWRPDFSKFDDFRNFETNVMGSYYLQERAIDYFYILDGYQRLSTLFGSLINPNKTNLKRNDKVWEEKFNLIYDIQLDKIKAINKIKYDIHEIPLFEFVDGDGYYDLQEQLFNLNYSKDTVELFIKRYRTFGRALSTYDMPAVEMYGGSIEEAIEIFTRLNSEGAKITDDWKLSALSFNKEENFRLGTEIDELIERLNIYNFKKIQRKIIFQCLTNSFGNLFFDQSSQGDISKLKKLVDNPNFIPITRNTLKSIVITVRFLFQELSVLDSKFLPYNNQLIFITDFFNKLEKPSQKQLDRLKHWFWITTYSNYFTIYNLSKQRKAYEEFQKFIVNENHNPIYYDKPNITFETVEFPSKIEMGSVRSKALGLFMLQYQFVNLFLDINRVSGYKKYYLFNDVEDINVSENTVLVIDDGRYSINKQNKDLSEWLSSEVDYSYFFITYEMKELFKEKQSKSDVLLKRKELIIAKEREFVENLSIKYLFY